MKMSDEFREGCRQRNLGKKLSAEHKAHIGESLKGKSIPRWILEKSIESRRKGMASHTSAHKLAIAKGCARALQEKRMGAWRIHEYVSKENGVVIFRSGWELRVAAWLDERNVGWKYEATFVETPFGVCVFDFTLDDGTYLEVKGVFSGKQEEKLKWCSDNGYVVRVIDKSNISVINLEKVLQKEVGMVATRCFVTGEV